MWIKSGQQRWVSVTYNKSRVGPQSLPSTMVPCSSPFFQLHVENGRAMDRRNLNPQISAERAACQSGILLWVLCEKPKLLYVNFDMPLLSIVQLNKVSFTKPNIIYLLTPYLSWWPTIHIKVQIRDFLTLNSPSWSMCNQPFNHKEIQFF